jgi:dTDP-4-amino-4,6-dideoxygalactose transaminase
LGAIGDGGALVTNSETIAHQAKVLRNYGQSQRYHHPELGLNSRLDELQAAILMTRMDWLDSFTARRKDIAKAYFEGIKNPKVRLLAPPKNSENHVYHLFVILSEQRDKLSDFLKELGVSNLIHYPIPVHHQVSCRNLKCDIQGLAYSETHANQCLSIPCHPQMSDADIRKVIEVVNAYG